MKDFDEFRAEYMKWVIKEMMGPGSENISKDDEHEIISENPIQRYSVGILYPQQTEMADYDEEKGSNEDIEEELESILSETKQIDLDIDSEVEDSYDDSPIYTSRQYYPSSIGMSFFVSGDNPSLKIHVHAAKYRKLNTEECEMEFLDILPEQFVNSEVFLKHFKLEDGKLKLVNRIGKNEIEYLIELYDNPQFKQAIYKLYSLQNNGWIREPISEEKIVGTIPIKHKETIVNGLDLVCIRRPQIHKNRSLFTVSIVNTNNENDWQKLDIYSFFQVGFKVEPIGENIEILEYDSFQGILEDPEELSNALLYRNKKSYAVGHGCSPKWVVDDKGKVRFLETAIIPFEEVPQMKFEIEELGDDSKEILSMRHLSDISPLQDNEIISKLHYFVNVYNDWIVEQQKRITTLPFFFHDIASKNLNDCKRAAERMRKGIEILKNDYLAFYAFKLANRAMMMQRVHTVMQNEKKWPDERLLFPDYKNIQSERASWRPFQLAFLLLNIAGLVDDNAKDREIVDLIWFSTGGGKTEAYLGVSAFLIFYRRLKYPNCGGGTSIIMRYTLRLLTAQQFQRASTLICACELIRKEIPLLGNDPVTIGLWIGSDSTPNKFEDAKKVCDELITNKDNKNPFQILSCPWCGTRLYKDNKKGSWGYKPLTKQKRFLIHCTNKQCPFNAELPIKVIDEDIYNYPPTLLFSTVDKFAMLPWKGEISRIFALDPENENRGPELIIQDELHLISGPLGTIVGLYETALDALCSSKGIKPKIISSTATIRRAKEQVKHLYNREFAQFPPPGIDSEDSFFSRVDKEKPGRLYVGIMATGKTQTTTLVRLYAALLHYIRELDYQPEIIDKYWTLVGYFNSIKELGKTLTLTQSDIMEQFIRISLRRGRPIKFYGEAAELTSRKKAEEIPHILEQLLIGYPNKQAVSILLATNMISVGVDIDRFGLMTVMSQPKTTSEYIQATSRVGRKYPGLIFVLYDGSKPRDRSHYETFSSFHQAFYKFVEPTSITPFSPPARERGLHAVFISLVRHLLNGLNKDNEASKFRKDLDGLENIKDIILNRVKNIMPEEYESTLKEINRYIDMWEGTAVNCPDLTYSNPNKNKLLYPYGENVNPVFRTLQSMRNVSEECVIRILD